MSYKPVVLIYDINNELVDDCAALIGKTGLYTSINTYNETNALEVIGQYNRFLGMATSRLSCLVTGWNSYKKPRDQLLFKMRAEERRSPFRTPIPVILITEDHRFDLKQMALDPTDGLVSAYLHMDDFKEEFTGILSKVVFDSQAKELNSVAYAKLQQEAE